MLSKPGLLDAPVLYLSRALVRNKADYYRLLQAVRAEDAWQDWVLYMVRAVAHSAQDACASIAAIKALLLEYKHRIRAQYRFYSQDLINNLFSHPYTRVELIERDLGVSRKTASNYLELLTQDGLLHKQKMGRNNMYINLPLFRLLTDIGGR